MTSRLRLVAALHTAVVCSVAGLGATEAHPNVQEADIRITMRDATTCEAQVRLRVETARPILLDHRVAVYDGTRVDAVVVSGEGIEAGAPQPNGPATQAIGIRLRAGISSYTIAYRVAQPRDRDFRCPVWLPAAPTDGVSRPVRVHVDLPTGAAAVGGSLPRMAWIAAGAGEATLAQMPALVRVPFTIAGQPVGWRESFDVTRVMDALAILALVMVTAAWMWQRGR